MTDTPRWTDEQARERFNKIPWVSDEAIGRALLTLEQERDEVEAMRPVVEAAMEAAELGLGTRLMREAVAAYRAREAKP